MKICDCRNRKETTINSIKRFYEMKSFFQDRVDSLIFEEIPVDSPYYVGRDAKGKEIKWYADKWYKCKVCGCIWEFRYPEFPAMGSVKKKN